MYISNNWRHLKNLSNGNFDIYLFTLFTGVMIKTSLKGSTRSFAMTNDQLEQVELRSNRRYDMLLDLKYRHQQSLNSLNNLPKGQKKVLKAQYETAEKGILGECIFRSLKFFDVGMSFMGDSLHNIYGGTFVRKLLKTIYHFFFVYRSEC